MDNRSVSVLGEKWDIEFVGEGSDPKLEECGGYCDLDEMQRRTLRHELVHAMAYESGLDDNSEWAMNEEMTAWVANQAPKMFEVFSLANAI